MADSSAEWISLHGYSEGHVQNILRFLSRGTNCQTLWEVKIDNMYCHENKLTQKASKLLIRVEYKFCRIDLFCTLYQK